MLLSIALDLIQRCKISVIPANSNKEPIASWKEYQKSLPVPEKVVSWFGNNSKNFLGVVCGSVSGNLQALDMDLKYDLTGTLKQDFDELINNTNPDLLSKLLIQKTMSGGYHYIFKCSEIEGNKKLASRAVLPDEKSHDADKMRVVLETRAEGGYIVFAPSEGYEIVQGDAYSIPEISPEERALLFAAAKSFNTYIKEEEAIPDRVVDSKVYEGLSPLDDFDARVPCSQMINLLRKYGWKEAFVKGDVYYLTRPGKTSGVSATYNKVPNRLYVFTTNSTFDNGRTYRACAVRAILDNNGDFSVTASQISREGYGNAVVVDEKKKVEVKEDEKKPAKIVKANGLLQKIKRIWEFGMYRGEHPGWDLLEKKFRIGKGQLTVISGIPTHGKSEFFDDMARRVAERHKWKTMVFSPENYPYETHVIKLVEKYNGSPFSGPNRMAGVEVDVAVDFVDRHFLFIDAGTDEVSLSSILLSAEKQIEESGLDMLLIDPWNELEDEKKEGESDHKFIGRTLKMLRKWARKYNIALFIIAHPIKLRSKVGEDPPVPTAYDIADSSHWFNKPDNILIVYRNQDDSVTVYVQKIKQKPFGRKGEVHYLYDRKNGRYDDYIPDLDEQVGGF